MTYSANYNVSNIACRQYFNRTSYVYIFIYMFICIYVIYYVYMCTHKIGKRECNLHMNMLKERNKYLW